MFYLQEFERPFEATFEIIRPFVYLRVNLDVIIWKLEISGWEYGGLDVRQTNFKGVGRAGGIRRRKNRDSDEAISRYCHRENRVERVIDVFSNDIYPTWGARHEVGGVAIGGLEGLQEMAPSFPLRWKSIGGVDVFKQADNGYSARHIDRIMWN